MVPKTFAYSPFNQLPRLLTRDYFIAFILRGSVKLFYSVEFGPSCRVYPEITNSRSNHSLITITTDTGNSFVSC
jgi:hypothetical protein